MLPTRDGPNIRYLAGFSVFLYSISGLILKSVSSRIRELTDLWNEKITTANHVNGQISGFTGYLASSFSQGPFVQRLDIRHVWYRCIVFLCTEHDKAAAALPAAHGGLQHVEGAPAPGTVIIKGILKFVKEFWNPLQQNFQYGVRVGKFPHNREG